MKKNEFIALCYHYIRPKKELDEFPKLLGIDIQQFTDHLKMLEGDYEFISTRDVYEILNQTSYSLNNPGMLITFDDGLSDHFEASKILEKFGIKGTFFIPSCVTENNLPANPIIIHYSIAKFGIKKFLSEYELALKKFNLLNEKNKIEFTKNKDPWNVIDEIKLKFKYEFSYIDCRKILLEIYENLLLEKLPNFMEISHLTNSQIKEMLEMGHSIGCHSHSHISIGTSKLTSEEFNTEMIQPKEKLEKRFKTKVISFSYPFGQTNDCLSTQNLLEKTNTYKIAFTVNPKVNSISTPPLELGRYELYSTDDTTKLKNLLENLHLGNVT